MVVEVNPVPEGCPIIHTTQASKNAKRTLQVAPATKTIILLAKLTGGSLVTSVWLSPSRVPRSASCGKSTYPPNGNQATRYSTPSLPRQDQIAGPNPIEN